jgi:UDP-N-acetylglucosamine acyltransferase
VSIDISSLVGRLTYRYPSPLIDAVTEHTPGERVVAVKNVTVGEEFFQGHFPGVPLMPGVLVIESLAQTAAILLFDRASEPTHLRACLRGVDEAKFRRRVVPGDRLRLEVTLTAERSKLARVRGVAYVGDQLVAEASLLLTLMRDAIEIDPSATVDSQAQIGEGTIIGPNAVIGRHVRLGRYCKIGASAVIDGYTEIGDRTEVFPFASIGLIPQDLKYKGEPTKLLIGEKNIFREFVTIHRGTLGGGGVTRIGHRNLFMAYAHVAHDSIIGNDTIFGNGATLGGHVTVEDFATISAGSGVHQFCRVGRHAFIGGYSVVTKDALPFAKTVGNRPARIYGVNLIGLRRRGVRPDVVSKVQQAYRYLLQAKLNTSRALAVIEQEPDLACDEVRYLVDFIRSSKRGVVLRRPVRRVEEMVADE